MSSIITSALDAVKRIFENKIDEIILNSQEETLPGGSRNIEPQEQEVRFEGIRNPPRTAYQTYPKNDNCGAIIIEEPHKQETDSNCSSIRQVFAEVKEKIKEQEKNLTVEQLTELVRVAKSFKKEDNAKIFGTNYELACPVCGEIDYSSGKFCKHCGQAKRGINNDINN